MSGLRQFSLIAGLILCAVIAVSITTVPAADRELLLASTTSTENSGLFSHILPIFEAETRIKTRVIAVGTGQALRLGRNGDADVLLVHDPVAEKAFVEAGFGVDRRAVMYNDFVLLGSKSDPANIKYHTDIIAALRAIASAQFRFVSRGDDSGTHQAERRLWNMVGTDVDIASGTWYREAGASMGATLNIASSMDAYTISDRATWISFRNKGKLSLLLSGGARLFNQYGVIQVNPAKHQHVNATAARQFADWLTSPAGQTAIRSFHVQGQQLFFPNASGS